MIIPALVFLRKPIFLKLGVVIVVVHERNSAVEIFLETYDKITISLSKGLDGQGTNIIIGFFF